MYKENKERYLFRKSNLIAAGATATVELLSGKSEVFKPTELFIRAYSTEDIECKNIIPVEICNITILGYPQLINYDGALYPKYRGTSLFFNNLSPINFDAFGEYPGQGLEFTFVNPCEQTDIQIDIIVKGYSVDKEDLAKNGKKEILFSREEIEPKSRNIITISGRDVEYFPNKLQIITLNENLTELKNIRLHEITNRGISELENIYDGNSLLGNIGINFFEEEKEVDFSKLNGNSKNNLKLIVENPLNEKVICYTKLIGNVKK